MSGFPRLDSRHTPVQSSKIRSYQSEYLQGLLGRDHRGLRAIAKLSGRIAAEQCNPKKAFTHQALSKWLRGIANPTHAHREVLAEIFRVSIDEFNQGIDGPHKRVSEIFRPMTVVVSTADRTFRYTATVGGGIDLSRPAVYRRWDEMFDPRPDYLGHHFHRLRHQLYGWVPDDSAFPVIRHPRALVALDTTPVGLNDENSSEQRVWFVYGPNSRVDVGFVCRKGRSLSLAKGASREVVSYPLSRSDLIGYISGRVVLRLEEQQ